MNIYKPSEDLKAFIEAIENRIYNTVYTFIILGKTGPTGKTYLTSRCIANGYRAVDMTEKILHNNICITSDDKNHYDIDERNRLITVILNKPLDKYKD